METRGQRSLTDITQQLADTLAQANAVAMGGASPNELGAAVCEIQSLRASFEAFICSTTVAADRACVAQRQGLRLTSQFVAGHTNSDPAAVRADSRLGDWLCDFAEFGDAFASGVMQRGHLEMIRKTLDNPRTRFALINSQQQLIEAARDCSFADFEKVVAYWLLAADPDGAEPADQISKTGFNPRQRTDGSVKLDGELDPLTGAAFMTAFRAEGQKLFRKDTQDNVSRPAAARGAHALMNLVIRGAARQDGAQPEPLINIVMSQKVAEETLARLDEPSVEPLSVAWNDIDGRCELIDGTPIHPNYALAVMGIAKFRRQIMAANSRIIDVSHNARCFPKWMKHALLIGSRGRCNTLGCDAPFAWLQADHITPHSRGGPTRLDNGQILCDPDNKHKRDKHAA